MNEKDKIASKVGMIEPFQNTLSMKGIPMAAIALGWGVHDTALQSLTGVPGLLTMAILPYSKGSVVTDIITNPLHPHALRILGGPSEGEKKSWRQGDHMVIWHASTATEANYEEHNFVNGYICTIDTDKAGPEYPKPGLENPKEGIGGMGCLYR